MMLRNDPHRALFVLCVAGLGCGAAPPSASSSSDCAASQVPDQRRDEDTIRRIERAWLTAELRGDTRFLQCLLLPDYVNIDKAGHKHPGADIVAHAARNRGQDREIPAIASTVVVNGDAATAYSASRTRDQAGQWRDVHFIDTFRFVDGAWRAFSGVDL
jgi:hypothetical protein